MREREQSVDGLSMLLLWLVTQAPTRTFIRLYGDRNVSVSEDSRRCWMIHNSTPTEAAIAVGAVGNANAIAPQVAQLYYDFQCISRDVQRRQCHAIPTLDLFGDRSAELDTDCDRGTYTFGPQDSWGALAAQIAHIRR